jgi:ketosteroid isomerase-like protein
VATIEQRLRLLEDERDIMRVLNAYCFAVDHGDTAEAFLELFTEDGVWWSSSDGRWMDSSGDRYTGHDELRVFWQGNSQNGKPGSYVKHMLGPSRVVIDGDHADVETYLTVLVEDERGPVVWMLGRYIDEIVRSADGEWRISTRHVLREDADERYRH